jgi:hypothetical protein
MERNQGVLALSLPQDPNGEDTSSNNNRGDDVSLTPLGLLTTSKSEWNEEQCDRSDKEDSTDNVELPEEVRGKVLETELLEGGSVTCEGSCSGCFSASDDKDGDDAERGD